MFEHIISVDRFLTFVNTLLLLVVAFLPFATGVLASTLRSGQGENVAVALYGWLPIPQRNVAGVKTGVVR